MKNNRREGCRSKRREYLAGVAASLSMVAGGAWFTWPAPLLPRLLAMDSPVPMTREQASWMVSCIEVGNLLGCYPAFLVADHFGRKSCLLLSAPGYMIGFLLTLFVKNFWTLCAARLVEGLALGMAYSILPCYLGEVASAEVRGTTLSMFYIAWGVGCLFPYCVGPYLSYDTFTYFTFSITVVFFLCFLWQPESPYYYAMKGDTVQAVRMLQILRGTSTTPETIQLELEEVQEEVKTAYENKASLKDIVATKEDRKALFLIIIVGVISFLNGQSAILTYTTDTFSKYPESILTPDNVTVGIGVGALAGSIFTIFTSDRLGRRFLLIFSAFGSMISLFITSVYFYLDSNTKVDVHQYSWIAAFALISFNLFVIAGMHPVCATYSSELFSTKTRGLASCISNFNLTFWSFLVIKCYEPLSTVGLYFPFLVFGLSCAVGIVIFYFTMPETKGKTFLEINEMLSKNRLK